MFRPLVGASALIGASAQSFTSCNTEDAHLKEFTMTSSPDPPVVGEDVTFTITGALDKQVTAGEIDISVKAGFITFPLKVPFQRNGAKAEDFEAGQAATLTLGPFTYPNINVPLIKTAKGHVEALDQDGEQVMCVDFALPTYSATAPPSTLKADPFADCSSPGAHIENVVLDVDPPTLSKGVPFTVRAQGDLNEDVPNGVLDLEVDVSLFSFGIRSPFSSSVPAAAGHSDITVGPITMPDIPLLPNAKGSIKMVEQNQEELLCYNFNVPLSEAASVAV